MFKKPADVAQAPSHNVSGADRKKLVRRSAATFSLDTEAAAALLPPKAKLTLARFTPPSRAGLYALEGVPWLLDARAGRPDDLVPTVHALAALPQLLPIMHVRHADVSHFLLKGADLMLPGVQVGSLPPQLPATALVAIAVPGNPVPFAVGRTLASAAQMREGAGGKGRAVQLVHVFRDALWNLAPGAADRAPAGFQHDGVIPLAAPSAEGNERLGSDEAEPSLQQAAAGMSLTEPSEQRAAEPSAGAAASAADADAPQSEEDSQAQRNGEAAAVSAEDMDKLLETALLQALHTSIKDKALPLAGAALWNSFLLPARPAGSRLDLKACSHKKLSKFLQAHGQAGSKLLAVREDKASGETLLTGVNRRHPLYVSHQPYSEEEAAGAAAPPASANDADAATGLQIEELFRPHASLKPVFAAAGRDPAALYTAQQAGEVAVAYAQQQRLADGASVAAHILLDATLCDALFKGVLKKGDAFPTELPKSQLRGALMNRMLPQLRISRGNQEILRKGAPPAVSISAEKRPGNKKVTKVSGFEAFLLESAPLAADLQKRFAASATINRLPGANAKGDEIVLQGEVVDKLAAYLTSSKHRIPGKYVAVKAPAKKKR